VTGRTAAASLPAGSLLAAGDIGAPGPARGLAQVGVALAPGRYPPGLAPGQHVEVLTAPPPGTAGPARPAGRGTVVSVSIAAPGKTVAELQCRRPR